MVTLSRFQMQRYGVAVLAVVLALLLMLLLNPWVTMTQTPFVMFFGAVVVSGWYGGMRAGLLATFLSALLSGYFFLYPIHSLALDLANSLRLLLFVAQGIVISALCGALRTANRRLEASLMKLRSSEERYRRLLDTAYEGIWALDGSGRINYVNERMTQMLGYSVEEMLDRPVFDFIDEKARHEQAQKFEQRKQGIKEQFDLCYRRKDGSPLWTIVSTSPIFSETGEFQGAIAMITDVSNAYGELHLRKRAEEERAILERKREEELRSHAATLQNQQKWLEEVLNFLPSPLLLIEPGTARVIYANRAADEIAGGEFPKDKPAEEYHTVYYCTDATGKQIPDDQMPGVRVARGERLKGFEMDWHTPGGIRSLLVVANTLPPIHGHPATCVVVFQDISERKQVEEALRQSEARSRRIVESNIIGVFFPELEGNILDANDAFLQMVGYEREDLLAGKVNWKDMSPPQYRALDEQKVEELKTYRVCTPFEKEYIRKDGRRIPLMVGAALLEESKQETVAFALDLSDRKQAVEALRESEERFRHMADTAPVLIWMSGTDKLCNYFNKPWLDFTGRTMEQELGNGWSEGVHPDDFQRCLNTYVNAFDTRQEFKMEYRLRRFDGEYRWVLDTGIPRFTPEGGFLGYIGSCIDISDRVSAEEEIVKLNQSLDCRIKERTAQLESANKELEAFSYSVSHDLRAPLRHISGFVDLLQKQAAVTLDETSLRYLKIIAQTTKQAGKLIDDLLAFSRMGRTQMRYTTFNMAQLVREVQREFEQETNGRAIRWQLEELPQVQGDPSMLRLVLHNLIGNAIKYTSPRKQAEIQIGSTSNDYEFVFFVRDNGVGFDMRYVHKLFGVFQRLHSSEQFEGTGIGLANVQRIIHRHGGRTWAEGVVDGGATFYFSLPKVAQ